MADSMRSAIIDIGWRINTNALERANKQTDAMIEKASKAEGNFHRTSRSIDSTTSSLDRSAKGIEKNSSSIYDFGNKSERSFTSTTRSAKATADQLQNIGDSAGESRSKVDGLEREFDESAESAKRLGNSASRSMKEIEDSAGGAGSKVKSIFSSAKERITGLVGGFKNLSKEATGSAGNIGSAIESGITKPLNIAKGIVGGLLATAGVSSASNLFSAGMDRLSSIENAQMSMEVMMGGDVDKAQGFMDEILTFAKTTPYAFTQLSTSAKNLFAYGMDQKDIVPTLQAIGDLSAASGKGSAGIDTLASAFGKMQVSGKASNEQLTQITEAGVPALKILGNQYGKTADEMREMVSKGEVSAKKAIDGLVKGIADGTKGVAGETQALGGVMEKLKGTWDGSLDSMKSSVTSTMATLLEPAKPHIQRGMAWFSDQFKKLPDLVSNGGKSLAPLWETTKLAFIDAKDFFVEDFIPTAKELASEFGPGLLEGAKASIETFSWTIEHVVKPPLSWLREYAEDHPDAMKKMGKYAAIGAAGFLAFNTVGKPIFTISGKITKFISLIAKIGDAALISSAKTKLGFEVMENSVPTGNPSGSLLDEAGELVQSRSAKHQTANKGWFKSLTKFFGGNEASNFGKPVVNAPVAEVGKHAGKMTFGAKMVGGVSRVGATAANAAKAVPGISYLTAATNLIGMNKDNATEKVGGSIGSLLGGAIGTKAGAFAAAKFGAVAGSAFGPIGTAVGGALGTTVGLFAGSKMGPVIGEGLSKSVNWTKKAGGKIVDDLAQSIENNKERISAAWEVLKATPGSVGTLATVGEGLWETTEPLREAFKKNPLDQEAISAKELGVNEDSAKNINRYVDSNNNVMAKLEYAKASGVYTEDDSKEVIKSYDKMNRQVTDHIASARENSKKDFDRLAELGVMSPKAVESASNRANKTWAHQEKVAKETHEALVKMENERSGKIEAANKSHEDKINAIKEKASKEKRELTEEENRKINDIEKDAKEETARIIESYDQKQKDLQDEAQKNAVSTLTASAAEQRIILGKLQEDSSELSAKQAQSMIQSSYKAKEETVKQADEQYKETVSILEHKFYATGEISKDEYEEALANAKKLKQDTIAQAEEQHQKIVDQAQQRSEGLIKLANLETGESLNAWDRFKRGLGETLNKVIEAINKPLSFFGIKTVSTINMGGSSRTNYNPPATSQISKLAYKGDRSTYSGPALVGEQGVELAYNKSTSTARLLGSNGPEMTQVASSERILPHKETMAVLNGGLGSGTKLPGFAKGKGTLANIKEVGTDLWEGAKDVGSKVVEGAKGIGSSVMNWLTDPVGQVKALIDKHNNYKNEATVSGFGFGTMRHIGNGMKDWAKTKFEEIASSFASNGSAAGSGAFAPRFGSPFTMTSGFGPRNLFGRSHHNGIDYAAPLGTPLPAQYPGSVSYAGWASGYGNLVAVNVAKGLHTLYGHMHSIAVKNGQAILAGQLLGSVGSTGDSTGPHVHYELRKGSVFGQSVNPLTYGTPAPTVSKSSGGVSQWTATATKALLMTGQFSALNLQKLLYQMKTESNGNPSAINNWDSNAKRGTPSKGLMQVIDPTFQSYKMPGFNNIWNPLDNILASIRYAVSRYGSLSRAYQGRGYAKGGRPPKGQTVLVGEKGPELFEADTAGTIHSHEKTKGLFENRKKSSITFSPSFNIKIEGDSTKDTKDQIKEAVQEATELMYAKLMPLIAGGDI